MAQRIIIDLTNSDDFGCGGGVPLLALIQLASAGAYCCLNSSSWLLADAARVGPMLASMLPLLFIAPGIEESMTVSAMAPPRETTPLHATPEAASLSADSAARTRAGAFSLPFLFS